MKKKPDRKVLIATLGLIAGACAAAAAGPPQPKGFDFLEFQKASFFEIQSVPAIAKKYPGDS